MSDSEANAQGWGSQISYFHSALWISEAQINDGAMTARECLKI